MSACRDFARWVIRESCFDGCDIDGAAVEEKAAALGLIVETNYDPAIHGQRERKDLELGDSYFEFSGELAGPDIEPRPPIFPGEWLKDSKGE